MLDKLSSPSNQASRVALQRDCVCDAYRCHKCPANTFVASHTSTIQKLVSHAVYAGQQLNKTRVSCRIYNCCWTDSTATINAAWCAPVYDATSRRVWQSTLVNKTPSINKLIIALRIVFLLDPCYTEVMINCTCNAPRCFLFTAPSFHVLFPPLFAHPS